MKYSASIFFDKETSCSDIVGLDIRKVIQLVTVIYLTIRLSIINFSVADFMRINTQLVKCNFVYFSYFKLFLKLETLTVSILTAIFQGLAGFVEAKDDGSGGV